MSYEITAAQIKSVTDVELAFSTSRFLPKVEDIPESFFRGNIYTEIAKCLFHGKPLPAAEIELADGVDPDSLNKCVRAHLQSFEPNHEHKIAGVGFMISKLAVITPMPLNP